MSKRIYINWNIITHERLEGIVNVYDNKTSKLLGEWNITVTQHSVRQYPIEKNKDLPLPFIHRSVSSMVYDMVRTYFDGLNGESNIVACIV